MLMELSSHITALNVSRPNSRVEEKLLSIIGKLLRTAVFSEFY